MKLFRSAMVAFGGVALAIAPALVLTSAPAGAAEESITFTTVGANEWTVPGGAYCVTVVAIGAQGGGVDLSALADAAASANGGDLGAAAVDAPGALGGSATRVIRTFPGRTIEVRVGGKGGDGVASGTGPVSGGDGGVNGGGDGGSALMPAPEFDEWSPGGGGGGASDVRIGGSSLSDRVLAAGGGGGAGGFAGGPAGEGGGSTGGDGADESNSTGGGGATLGAGGAGGTTNGDAAVGSAGSEGFGGDGADGTNLNGGGGGGGAGWFGGGGGGGVLDGNGSAAAGGGGSSFGFATSAGVDAGNGGNGKVTLSWTEGDTSCLAAPLTVQKTTTGAAPTPGQTFTIRVACNGNLDSQQVGSADSVDLTFTADANGVVQPAAGYTVGFDDPGECSVAEIDTGGAIATTYACEGSGAELVKQSDAWLGDSAVTRPEGDPCVQAGPQAEPIAVEIIAEEQVATVTVTNELVTPAAAQVVQPRFTG
ncbi:MAG: glycine-rich protein [Acidimicrobiia bacterium]